MAVDPKQAADPAPGRSLQPAGWRRGWRRLAVWGLLLAGWSWGQAQTLGAPAGKPASPAWAQKLAAAGRGEVEAQLQVGKIYYQGKAGREKAKRAEAVRWFQAAAEQGSAEAAAWLGACYLLGRGVGQDRRKAQRLLETAAQQGDAVGLRFLGLWYERGQDYRQAAGWYGQAVEHGDSHALLRLAHLYAHGLGLAADKKKADSLLIQAAGQGGEWAQLRLGRIYERGDRGLTPTSELLVALTVVAFLIYPSVC